ncbi:response regulator [Cellvibrio polysaccharolyticus]|uniref:Response regulator n=1 Tax=Cellvibrio polysaccharolyticus TaxID=2082724 RepID=A0A928V4N1_9GAMM|nr:response regulator [Cellvibrio polysaccharolyticus]MBE8718703.1 response regulator [Cellvibrio polysaccharolyticus]
MKPARVMIVDDSPVDLMNLKQIVSDAGYQVVTAANGQEAYNKARSCHPDLIFMDVVMDGVDGFEACRNIVSDKELENIPVFFVTSKNQRADKVWGELQGGRGMISKPYTPEQILDVIAGLQSS